jgi:hypothetical protein
LLFQNCVYVITFIPNDLSCRAVARAFAASFAEAIITYAPVVQWLQCAVAAVYSGALTAMQTLDLSSVEEQPQLTLQVRTTHL